jgi:hypothetical protein
MVQPLAEMILSTQGRRRRMLRTPRRVQWLHGDRSCRHLVELGRQLAETFLAALPLGSLLASDFRAAAVHRRRRAHAVAHAYLPWTAWCIGSYSIVSWPFIWLLVVDVYVEGGPARLCRLHERTVLALTESFNSKQLLPFAGVRGKLFIFYSLQSKL